MSAAPGHTQPRLPAFGRELLELRRQGLRPEGLLVVALDTWEFGKAYARAVIAKDVEPANTNFAFVADLDVALIWLPTLTPIARRDAAIRRILFFNPASLRVIVMADPVGWIWVKSHARGLEMPEMAA